MRLFLVARHGQSLFNVDKLVNGDPTLDRGLSEQGIEEAERLAGQLAALPLDSLRSRPSRAPSRPPTSHSTAAKSRMSSTTTRRRPHRRARRRIARRLPRVAGALEPEGAFPRRREPRRGGARYAGAFERLLARDEQVILVVCHEIPVRYLVNAAAGSAELNGPLKYVANADPYLFEEASLHRAVQRIRELAG